MARQMTTLDETVKIEVKRKEKELIPSACVYAFGDTQPKLALTHTQIVYKGLVYTPYLNNHVEVRTGDPVIANATIKNETGNGQSYKTLLLIGYLIEDKLAVLARSKAVILRDGESQDFITSFTMEDEGLEVVLVSMHYTGLDQPGCPIEMTNPIYVIPKGEEEKVTIPITFTIFNMTDNLTREIGEAVSFINKNTPESVNFVSKIIHFNEATNFTYREYNCKRCSSLEAWNVRNMGYEENLPKYCIGYYLLWKHLPNDEPCVGGEASWPPAGVNRRSTASTAYNVWDWDLLSWGTNMTRGVTVIIHELHHMFALTLDDEGYYPQSYSMVDHQYGKTIPFIDSKTSFGFSDEYEWTLWCYSQLTYDMCKELSEIAATEPHPPIVIDQCILTFTTPGYNITVDGEKYETPIEIPTHITSIETEQGTVYEAREDVLIKSPGKECYTTISAFRMVGDLWALNETAASDCLFDILGKYTGSTSRLVISLKEIEEIEEVNGTIDISSSIIPTTLYLQTSSSFEMAVINTGASPAEYQVAITFEGVDTQKEEVFWSEWGEEIAPHEQITLHVLVELSEEAIPAGVETAEYNILTRLVAR